LILDLHLFNILAHDNQNIMCWASNHQSIYRNGPRAHFPFNLPLFGDLCQHIKSNSKCNNIFKRGAKECKLKTNSSHIRFGIFGSLLPPLGLFSQNKFFFLSLYQKHLFWQIKGSFKSKFDQMPKTPPFRIINFLPHKRNFLQLEGFDQTIRI
jgi:hypothetical protein